MEHRGMSKLKSNRGASMILALVLFLVCTMVSSVIIATASSGLSRNAQREEQQYAYLAISSAADYILEELETSGVYVGASQLKEYGCKDCSIAATMEYFGQDVSGYRLDANFIPNPLDDGHLMIPIIHTDDREQRVTNEENCTLEDGLERLLKRAAKSVYETQTEYEEQLKLSLVESDPRFPDVICDFSMDRNYNISFHVYAVSQDYSIRLEAAGIVYEREPVVVQDDSDIHTIYYRWFNEATGAFEDKTEQLVIPVKVITTVTEVRWGIPKVEKGGLSS